MIKADAHHCQVLFRHEIKRFQEFAQLRCEQDETYIRRFERRYHRSWPLMVASYVGGCLQEHSAALHDACEGGIGFMSEQSYEVDGLVYIKLFWHDVNALFIPARVIHVCERNGCYLVGTNYLVDDYGACELALHLEASI